VLLLLIFSCVLVGLLVWVMLTADAEQQQREVRQMRDLDMRR
jgi:hypothetical protein